MNDPVRTRKVTTVHVPEPLTHAPVVPSAQSAHFARIVTAQGEVVTGYLMQQAEQQQPVAPLAVREPLPLWVRSVAVLMPVTAGSAALGFWGLSLAIGSLAALADILWNLFLALLALSAVVVVTAAMCGRRGGRGGSVTATATATSRGLFGKATARATATAKR